MARDRGINKLNSQSTNASSFGWCLYCLQRVGQRRFRQLNDAQMCEDCFKKYKPFESAIKTNLTHDGKALVKSHTVCKQTYSHKRETSNATVPLKSAKKLPKPPSEAKLTRLLEEDELKKALDKIEVGNNWREACAKHLNWPTSKVRAVGRRLVNKGFLIPPKPIEDMILEILAEKPFSTCYQVAESLPIGTEWTREILGKLVKQGKVIVSKDFYRNKPDKYSINNKTQPVSSS